MIIFPHNACHPTGMHGTRLLFSAFHWLSFVAIATLFACLFSTTASAKGQCPDDVVRSLTEALHIEPSAEIRDFSCKILPTDKRKVLVVLAYALPGHVKYDDDLPYHLALMQLPSMKVLNHYKGKIVEDASQWVDDGYFTIDTARYELSKSVRAFALREGGFHESGAMDHGAEDKFTLYLLGRNGGIRPIFSIPYMRFWWYDDDQNKGQYKENARIGKIAIAVQDTETNGFRDLMATASEENTNRIIFKHLLQYDGSTYQSKELMKKIYTWWHQ